jgi:hypothetical protein
MRMRRRGTKPRFRFTLVEVVITVFMVGSLALGIALTVALIRFLWLNA